MSIQVSTRIDELTKRQFDEICDSIGISPSNALSIFIKSVINNNGIPFAVIAPTAAKETLPEKEPVFAKEQIAAKEPALTKTLPELDKAEQITAEEKADDKASDEVQIIQESVRPKKRAQEAKNTLEHYENFFKKWEAGRKVKGNAELEPN